MNSFLNILIASLLAILFINTELQAANVPLADVKPQQKLLEQQSELGHNLTNIQIVKDVKLFLLQNPHLQLIRLHKKTPHDHQSQSVKYTLGNRVEGDRFITQYADTFYYPNPRDVSVQVTYPETGYGSIVTFVDIHCLQDDADGNAYVVAGGIGQRFISIVLEAQQTKRFTYNVHIYCKD